MMLTQSQRALLIGCVITLWTVPVRAATLTFQSFSGNLSTDDSVSLFDFTVDAPSRVGIRTFSYGGGRLANGTDISPGGFDPILTLFDSNSSFITFNDDGEGRVDPTTGSAFDSRIVRSLNPGTYTVAVSQFDNFHDGSSGNPPQTGFEIQGEPNFTANNGCSAGQFCDINGDSRTNQWVAEVPESSTILGSGLLLGILGFVKYRRWRSVE